MTMPEDTETQEPDSPVLVIHKYFIDAARARELDHSLAVILLSRRCASCRAKLEANQENPTEEQHMKEIAKSCSTQDGFIRPEMPMQEIIFRMLLSRGNKPVNLEELHYAVTDEWYTPANPRSITLDNLKRVLEYDMYYGFKEVLETSVEESG